MEAMKEQMATMMEAMMSMKKIMEDNVAAIAATSTIAEVDLTPHMASTKWIFQPQIW